MLDQRWAPGIVATSPPIQCRIVSLGSTAGLRQADKALQESLEAAGASVARAQALAPTQVRTLLLTDLSWARAARM